MGHHVVWFQVRQVKVELTPLLKSEVLIHHPQGHDPNSEEEITWTRAVLTSSDLLFNYLIVDFVGVSAVS